MPSVTYDGRSFMIDGRRIWLVSASIPFFRIPRESWKDRIHAAKLAGFNTIEAPIIWSRCEPRPGQFDFKGENDVRHIVELIGQAGLYATLRVGPHVNQGWDLGGIPEWLVANPEVKPRSANQPFLEATSRFFSQLISKVKDLQVTSTGKGGALLLVQVEHEWTCSDAAPGQTYLGELNRYLRETGLNVPTINANNLWQGVEGEIDCWVGEMEMLTTMRQLGSVLPDQPRIVAQFGPHAPGRFGLPAPEQPDPRMVQRAAAEVLAGGGQFNLSPFASGQTPGFCGGRLKCSEGAYLTPESDLHAPIDVLGRTRPRYHAVRHLATFASQFARVFANLETEHEPVVLAPGEPGESKPGKSDFGPTIVHRRGSQGSVCFIFPQNLGGTAKTRGRVNLLLSDGSTLPVELGGNFVHWCLFDAHLSGRAMLTYSSLCVLGVTGAVLSVYGGAGTTGHLAINGSPLEVTVPTGKAPLIIEHEGVFVVVCNDQTIETTFVGSDAVFVGINGLDDEGKPFGTGRYTRITAEGETSVHTLTSRKGKGEKLAVGTWACASATEHSTGTNPRYATIPGPAPLSELGSAHGYGWYRVSFKLGAAKKVKVMAPRSEDRFQVLIDGEPSGIIGEGPNAALQLNMSLKKGDRTIVLLADNMGHVCEGSNYDRKKGLCDELYEVTEMKIGKPSLELGEPLSPLSFRTPLFGVRDDDQTYPHRVCWHVVHRRKSPLLVCIPSSPARGLFILNGEPFRFLDRGETAMLVLGEEELKRGNNVFEFAAIHEFGDEDESEAAIKTVADALNKTMQVWEGTNALTGKGTWAFAKWEMPKDFEYEEVSKAAAGKVVGPSWWRVPIEGVNPGEALRLTLTGMTKGQVFLNGESLCRYWVATADGTDVPPMDSVILHASQLTEGENELVLFDEHGGNPTKCKFTVEPVDEVIRAQL
jgi:beta-galactosidase